MSFLIEGLEDLMRLGVISWRRKEEPKRIYDDIENATRLYTYINSNDGSLQPGLCSYFHPAYLDMV